MSNSKLSASLTLLNSVITALASGHPVDGSKNLDLEDEVDAFAQTVRDKHPGLQLDYFFDDQTNTLNVARIIVPKDQRNQGIGTAVMQELLDFAKRKGLKTVLTPEPLMERGNKGKLDRFYKRLGFKRNTDPAVSERLMAASTGVTIPPAVAKNIRGFEGTLAGASSWQAKVILANNGGKKGAWDNVGYVLVNPKTGVIVPVARNDEHQTGYELLYHYQRTKAVSNAAGFTSIYSHGRTYAYFTDPKEGPRYMEAFKFWLDNGGDDLIVTDWQTSRMGTISAWLKGTPLKKAPKGKLAPGGAGWIRALEALTQAYVTAVEKQDKNILTSSDIDLVIGLAEKVNDACEAWAFWDGSTTKAIEEAREENSINKIGSGFLGHDGVKNDVHITLKEIISGENTSRSNVGKYESFFGDLNKANEELIRLAGKGVKAAVDPKDARNTSRNPRENDAYWKTGVKSNKVEARNPIPAVPDSVLDKIVARIMAAYKRGKTRAGNVGDFLLTTSGSPGLYELTVKDVQGKDKEVVVGATVHFPEGEEKGQYSYADTTRWHLGGLSFEAGDLEFSVVRLNGNRSLIQRRHAPDWLPDRIRQTLRHELRHKIQFMPDGPGEGMQKSDPAKKGMDLSDDDLTAYFNNPYEFEARLGDTVDMFLEHLPETLNYPQRPLPTSDSWAVRRGLERTRFDLESKYFTEEHRKKILQAVTTAYRKWKETAVAQANATKPETRMTKVISHIRKSGDKWVVTNKAGDKTLGTHDSKESAMRQLRAIEMHKHMGSLQAAMFKNFYDLANLKAARTASLKKYWVSPECVTHAVGGPDAEHMDVIEKVMPDVYQDWNSNWTGSVGPLDYARDAGWSRVSSTKDALFVDAKDEATVTKALSSMDSALLIRDTLIVDVPGRRGIRVDINEGEDALDAWNHRNDVRHRVKASETKAVKFFIGPAGEYHAWAAPIELDVDNRWNDMGSEDQTHSWNSDTLQKESGLTNEEFWKNYVRGTHYKDNLELDFILHENPDVKSALASVPQEMRFVKTLRVDLKDQAIEIPVLEGEDALDAWNHRNDVRHRVKAAEEDQGVCLMAMLPPELAQALQAWGEENIPDKDVYEVENENPLDRFGREKEPHVTIIFGAKDGANGDDIRRFVETAMQNPIKVKLGKVSKFKNWETGEPFDVVKVLIEGDGIHDLNASLKEAFGDSWDFDVYKPHATLSYVLPGTCEALVDNDELAGHEFVLDHFVCRAVGQQGDLFNIKAEGSLESGPAMVEASMVDYPHESLPTDMWDKDEDGDYRMKESMATGIMKTVGDVLSFDFDGVETWLKAVYLQGSSATQFYVAHSDIDIQAVIDLEAFKDAGNHPPEKEGNLVEDINEVLKLHDQEMAFEGHPVEVRVRSLEKAADKQFLADVDALYDVTAMKWIKKPKLIKAIKYNRNRTVKEGEKMALQVAAGWDLAFGEMRRDLHELEIIKHYYETEPNEPKQSLAKAVASITHRVSSTIKRLRQERKAIREKRRLAGTHRRHLRFDMINTHPDVVCFKLLQEWGYFQKVQDLELALKIRDYEVGLNDCDPLLDILTGREKSHVSANLTAKDRTPEEWDAEAEVARQALSELELEKTLHQGKWAKKDQHGYQNMRNYWRMKLATADAERLHHQQTQDISRQDTDTLEKMLVSINEQMAPMDAMPQEEYSKLPADQKKEFARLLYRREAIQEYLKDRPKAPTWKDIMGGIEAGLSSVLYHTTSLVHAVNIVDEDRFILTASQGSRAEREHSKKGKPFFLSCARTPTSRYFQGNGPGNAILVLDGEALGHTYKGGPVDYWGREFRQIKNESESEDRIYSTEPEIPNATRYIKEIHILVSPESAPPRSSILAFVRAGIPFWIYQDKKAYSILDKSAALPLADLYPKKEASPARAFPPSEPTDPDDLASVKYWRRKASEKEDLGNIPGIAELLLANSYEALTDQGKKVLKKLVGSFGDQLYRNVESDSLRRGKAPHPSVTAVMKAADAAGSMQALLVQLEKKWNPIYSHQTELREIAGMEERAVNFPQYWAKDRHEDWFQRKLAKMREYFKGDSKASARLTKLAQETKEVPVPVEARLTASKFGDLQKAAIALVENDPAWKSVLGDPAAAEAYGKLQQSLRDSRSEEELQEAWTGHVDLPWDAVVRESVKG